MSWPKRWKHLAFDGQLLHGTVPECTTNLAEPSRRLTFLVNVWLHHRPSNCRRLAKVGRVFLVDVLRGWTKSLEKNQLGWLKRCNEWDMSYLHYIYTSRSFKLDFYKVVNSQALRQRLGGVLTSIAFAAQPMGDLWSPRKRVSQSFRACFGRRRSGM